MFNFVFYLFEPDVIPVIKLSCISYFVTVVFFRIVGPNGQMSFRRIEHRLQMQPDGSVHTTTERYSDPPAVGIS